MVTEAEKSMPLPVPLWYVALSFIGFIAMMSIYGVPAAKGHFWPEGPLFAYIVAVGVGGGILAFIRQPRDDDD